MTKEYILYSMTETCTCFWFVSLKESRLLLFYQGDAKLTVIKDKSQTNKHNEVSFYSSRYINCFLQVVKFRSIKHDVGIILLNVIITRHDFNVSWETSLFLRGPKKVFSLHGCHLLKTVSEACLEARFMFGKESQ